MSERDSSIKPAWLRKASKTTRLVSKYWCSLRSLVRARDWRCQTWGPFVVLFLLSQWKPICQHHIMNSGFELLKSKGYRATSNCCKHHQGKNWECQLVMVVLAPSLLVISFGTGRSYLKMTDFALWRMNRFSCAGAWTAGKVVNCKGLVFDWFILKPNSGRPQCLQWSRHRPVKYRTELIQNIVKLLVMVPMLHIEFNWSQSIFQQIF